MELLNKFISSQELSEQFFNIDAEIMASCEKEALVIAKKHMPDIGIGNQENIDLVVRPLSATIAMYEIMLQNLFSFSSIKNLANSTTTPEYVKVNLMRSMAKSVGISVFGVDSKSIMNQIDFFTLNTDTSGSVGLSNTIFEGTTGLNRLYFADTESIEMTRNKIPLVQLGTTEQMNFSTGEMNPGNLVSGAYSRSDYQRYIDYSNSKKVVIPGMLDVYFDSGIIIDTFSVSVNQDGLYEIPSGYYFSISHSTKDSEIVVDDSRKDGIIKSPSFVHISGGESTETITAIGYNDCFGDEKKISNRIVSGSVEFKGMFPMMSSISIRSRKMFSQGEKDEIKNILQEYAKSNGGQIERMSSFDMQSAIRSSGYDAVISSSFMSRLYTQTNSFVEMNVTFPMSMSDIPRINIPNSPYLTPNNITFKIEEVIFETE